MALSTVKFCWVARVSISSREDNRCSFGWDAVQNAGLFCSRRQMYGMWGIVTYKRKPVLCWPCKYIPLHLPNPPCFLPYCSLSLYHYHSLFSLCPFPPCSSCPIPPLFPCHPLCPLHLSIFLPSPFSSPLTALSLSLPIHVKPFSSMSCLLYTPLFTPPFPLLYLFYHFFTISLSFHFLTTLPALPLSFFTHSLSPFFLDTVCSTPFFTLPPLPSALHALTFLYSLSLSVPFIAALPTLTPVP